MILSGLLFGHKVEGPEIDSLEGLVVLNVESNSDETSARTILTKQFQFNGPRDDSYKERVRFTTSIF